jgi:hypothetical protein
LEEFFSSRPKEEVSVKRLMESLRGMTEEQQAEIVGLLGVAATPAKRAAAAPKKSAIPAARKVAAAAPLPEPDDVGAPSADAYRIKEDDIDHTVCVGRILKGGKDKRWKPTVYREFQCGRAAEEDCDLCKICQTNLEKYAEDLRPGAWCGRVTEEPLGWVHMLGTEWAETRKPRWLGEGAASDSGSELASAASATSSKKWRGAGSKEITEEQGAAWLKGNLDFALEELRTPYLKAMCFIMRGKPWDLVKKYVSGTTNRAQIEALLLDHRAANIAKVVVGGAGAPSK